MVTFAKIIEAALRHQTQAELGERLLASQQAVSDYLRGLSLPRSRMIPVYAKVLRISEDRLRKIIEADRIRLGHAAEASGTHPIVANESQPNTSGANP